MFLVDVCHEMPMQFIQFSSFFQSNKTLFLSLFLISVLCWHLTAVTYSLYKQIKEDETGPNNTTVTNEVYSVPQYPGPGAYTLPQYPAVESAPQYPGANNVSLYPSVNTAPQDQTSKA